MQESIVKISATEFGIEESKAKEVEAVFSPMLSKMSELENEFNQIVNLPINKDTCAAAKSLRLKYVKVRTATAEIHKGMKAYALSFGRFVDGWKNAQIHASQGIEDRLETIEKHYENAERERIANLQQERSAIVSQFAQGYLPDNLGTMAEDVWNNYLSGAKSAYAIRIEAEQKAERERIQKEQEEAAERERIKQENARLKAEAAERERLERERIAKEKKELEEREKIESAERAEREAKERKQREEYEAKISAERAERERLEREKKEREEKEAKRIEEEKKNAKKIAMAPDKEKLLAYSAAIKAIPHPALKSDAAASVASIASQHLAKLCKYIEESANNL